VPQPHHQPQAAAAPGGGPDARAATDVVVSREDDARRAKAEELKEHPLKDLVLASLGRWYMANHGVTSMSMVEDMRTVLIAYWGVAAKRITENVCALLETHLLATIAEDLEKRLLSVAQSDDPKTIDALLAQDDDTKRQRAALKKQKDRVAASLNSINRFAPNLVARPREPLDKPKAPDAPPTQHLGGHLGGDGTSTSRTTAGTAVASGGRGGPAAAPAAPPAKRPAPGQLVESFKFSSNGDNGGFVYWLGTSGRRERFANPHDKGRLRVTSSGLASGHEALLVARKRQPCWTRDVPDSWICLDLGRNRALSPTHYTLCNGSPHPGFDLLAWALEGYDADQDLWIDLAANVGRAAIPRSLASPWGVQTFALDHKQRAWRYLRIRHTGLNSRGTHEMPICAWEFYGDLWAMNTTS